MSRQLFRGQPTFDQTGPGAYLVPQSLGHATDGEDPRHRPGRRQVPVARSTAAGGAHRKFLETAYAPANFASLDRRDFASHAKQTSCVKSKTPAVSIIPAWHTGCSFTWWNHSLSADRERAREPPTYRLQSGGARRRRRGSPLRYGVAPTPRIIRRSGRARIASAFLDAGNSASLGTLVNCLMTHGSLKTGRPMRPDVARALAPRLGQAAVDHREIAGGSTETISPGGGSSWRPRRPNASSAPIEGRARGSGIRYRALLRAVCAGSRTCGRHGPAGVAGDGFRRCQRIAARRYAPGLVGTVTPIYPGFRLRRAVRRTFV